MLGRSGKRLITSLYIKAKTGLKKCKNARYYIGNVSKNDHSKIIRKFEKLPYASYERRRPNYEPNDSYFCLARQIAKCTMRADALNSQVYPVRMEMNGTQQIPTLHVCSNDKSELKEFLADKNIL